MSFNPFTWDNTSRHVHSAVLTLELKGDKRNSIDVSKLSSDVWIKIPLNSATRDQKNQNFFTSNHTSRFHEINVDYENTLLQLEITPVNATVTLVIFVKFGRRPTIEEHDLNGTVSNNESCVWRRAHQSNGWERVCFSTREAPIAMFAQKPGKYYVEVRSQNSLIRPKQGQEESHFAQRSCVEVKSPPHAPFLGEKEIDFPTYDPRTDHNYTMRVALGSCVYWSDESDKWTTKGCKVRINSPAH